MKTNLDRYKKDLDQLVREGGMLYNAIQARYLPDEFNAAIVKAGHDPSEFREKLPDFNKDYQRWYSEAKALIRQLLPDRLDDFVRYYETPRSRKSISSENYRIEDALQGLRVPRSGWGLDVGPKHAIPHFWQQLNILEAVKARFESSLFDIKQLLQADLFDSELDAARELQKNGYLRAAGAVAGVVLEGHLKAVAANHSLSTKKGHPTISDFNDLLKAGNVLDVPEWRRIQRLGDLRNLCDHAKGRDPTGEEITELIAGVDKTTRTVF
jgi:hypothetical protein